MAGTLPARDPQREARVRRLARCAPARRRARAAALLAACGLAALATLSACGVAAQTTAARTASAAAAALARADALPAPAPVTRDVAGVSASLLDQVGTRATLTVGLSVLIDQAPLRSGGKPEVFFEGAEFCPHCAADSWPLAIALSRFGRLSGLGVFQSAVNFIYPHTAGLTFYAAAFASPYVTFVPLEYTTPQPQGKFYVLLQQPTAAESALLGRLNPTGGVPFMDFGQRYILTGATYNPGLLHGLPPADIAAAAAQAHGTVGVTIDAAANLYADLICAMDGARPASVCASTGVRAAAPYLRGSGPNGT